MSMADSDLEDRANETVPGESDDENDPLRKWVKQSLAASEPTEAPPDLLPGVQRRIRLRSRGKFFADGWSTTHTRMSYALVGITTLILVALACFVLSPWYSQ
jgi:hypothetical protein